MSGIKVLVTNQKGGVGKSTIAANLAAYLAVQNNVATQLIDFDKQSSSAKWIEKAPSVGLQVCNPKLDYLQSGGLVLSEAKRHLHKLSLHQDISICDLTWGFGIPSEFLLEFDIILVPTMVSKFDVASSEIFILEYLSKHLETIKRLQQQILVVPSKVSKTFNPQQNFLNLVSIDHCSISPPIKFIPAMDHFIYEDFLCVSTNPEISDNFCVFGQHIAELVNQKIKDKQNALLSHSSQIQKSAKLSILDRFRSDRRQHQEDDAASRVSIPQFLKKNI